MCGIVDRQGDRPSPWDAPAEVALPRFAAPLILLPIQPKDIPFQVKERSS